MPFTKRRINVKKLSLEELEAISPELRAQAERHGLTSLSMEEVIGMKTKGSKMRKRLPTQEQNTVAADMVVADRQWLWRPSHYGVDKAPKEQVNYRTGLNESRMELRNQVCASCRFLMPREALPEFEEQTDNPDGVEVLGRCELVEGDMFSEHTCDVWQPSHERTGKYLRNLHAAEAAIKGEPFHERNDPEYVESALEFIEAGEDPDAVIDFLVNPSGKTEDENIFDIEIVMPSGEVYRKLFDGMNSADAVAKAKEMFPAAKTVRAMPEIESKKHEGSESVFTVMSAMGVDQRDMARFGDFMIGFSGKRRDVSNYAKENMPSVNDPAAFATEIGKVLNLE